MSSKKHESNVNWRKVIGNFRSSYQLGAAWEILIVELLANSIDAGAKRIWVEMEGEFPKILRVVDSGRGMKNLREFDDYHNLGSLTKRKGGGIGWAGIGAKLYIDRCKSIYTETRSRTFSGASRWSFPKSRRAPVWEEVSAQGLLGGKRGTAVEIVLSNKKDSRRMTEEMVRAALLANYNYALQPISSVVVTLNGVRIHPFSPAEHAEKLTKVTSRLKAGGHIGGEFALLKEKAPPGFALMSIVVHGKTVGGQYDFKQFARIRDVDRISGYIRGDELIHVVTTSKDNFNRKTSIWRDFDKKAGKMFSDWLEDIGQLKRTEVDRGLRKLATQIQKDLNKVFRLPEIRKLRLDLFQKLARRLRTLPDPLGDETASEVTGLQTVPGTLPGPGEGGGVPIPGDEPGMGIEADPQGEISVSRRKRQSRSGIQIAFVNDPDRTERAYPDPGLQAIAINEAHPAFKVADAIGEETFYTIDACFDVVTEVVEDEQERRNAARQLFQGYLKVAGKA